MKKKISEHILNHKCWCGKSTKVVGPAPLRKQWVQMICPDKHLTYVHRDPEEQKRIDKENARRLHPALI